MTASNVDQPANQLPLPTTLVPVNSCNASSFQIELLVLENFKSFRGRCEIRGFTKLTAIIGPNGAGKSNLMDAISFVLGTQPRSMRGRMLTDLIYRPGSSSTAEEGLFATQLVGDSTDDTAPKEASVILLLRNTDGAGETLQFERRIVAVGATGRSIFRVDGKTVTLEAYQRRMAGLNMLLRAKNFLVFQGDVVEVAQKSESDLGRLFEQISGSENLKERYTQLESEAQRLASELKYHTLQRQRIEDQRRDLEKQVDEINDYRKLESKLAETRTKLTVYRLYCNENMADKTKEALEASEMEATTLEMRQNTLTCKLRELDGNFTKIRLKKQQAEKERREAESALSISKSETAELSEQVSFLQKQFAQAEIQQQKEMEVLEVKNLQKKSLESTLDSLEKEIQAIDAEEEEARANPVPLTESQRAEYQTMKQQASSRTAALKSTAMALESKESLLKSRSSLSTSEVMDVGSRVERIDLEIGEILRFIDTSAPELEVLQSDLSDFEAQYAEETSKLEESIQYEKSLVEERAQLESELNIIGGNMNESHHTVKTQRLILELQDVFPGQVFGTVVGLCRPTSRKLAVAATAALGKYLECVVVDSFETAKKAVAYLKQRKAGVLELAALDSLSITPLDVRMRQLVSNVCRPAIDCIDFDPKFELVYRMALGDTMIVDTLEEAERLAFEDTLRLGVRFKFVTLDGEKILKNGNFTVDATNTHRNRRSLFDSAEASKLTAKLQEIESLLRVRTTSQLQASLSNLQATLNAKRTAVASRATKLSVWKERLQKQQNERAEAEQLLNRLKAENASVDAQLQSCRAEMEQVQQQIQVTEEDLLKSNKFRGRLADIATLILEEERRKLDSRRRFEKRQKILVTQQKTSWELQRTSTDLAAETSSALKTKLETLRKQLENLSRETLRKKNAQELQQASLMAATASLAVTASAQDKVEKEISALQAEAKQARNQYRTVEAKVQKLRNDSEHLVNQAMELLKAAIVSGVSLPLTSGSIGSFRRLLGLQDDSLGQVTATDADMEIESEADANAAPEIDYDSVLSDDLKEAAKNPQRQRTNECKLEEELGSYVNLLGRRTPNFKAKEKHVAVLLDLETLEETIRKTKLDKEAREREFHSVCKERSRLFLACFQHVQKAIHATYGRLTATHNRVAGEAYLELSNDGGNDRAFCSDVLYHVIPPFKRFSDLKRLSGGEKTMAALALLFAMQSYYPSPFFVMDEIDADLDPINVTSLARFLRSVEVQVVIISHADRVFSQADSLIGVYIDPLRESSGVLTLDLAQYPRAALPLHHDDCDSPSDHGGDYAGDGDLLSSRWMTSSNNIQNASSYVPASAPTMHRD